MHHVTCLAAPLDFTTVNQRVTIFAGSTQVPINIPIVDDSLQESTERFSVLIERIDAATPAGVTIGTPNPTIVEITDNES